MEGTFVVEVLVDDDRAGRVQGDARGLEPQPRRVGPSPGGDQDLVDFERFSVGEIYAQGWAGFADPHRQASKPKLDAGASHLLAQAVAHVFVESAQDIAGAHDLSDLGPEPPEQRGELDRDIAASHHEQPARKRSEVENLVRGDGVLQPFDERQELGPGAGRNQDVPRGDLTTVGEAHLMSADYFGPLFDRFDARRFPDSRDRPRERRVISFSLAATSFGHSKRVSPTLHPKPSASRKASAKRLA